MSAKAVKRTLPNVHEYTITIEVKVGHEQTVDAIHEWLGEMFLRHPEILSFGMQQSNA